MSPRFSPLPPSPAWRKRRIAGGEALDGDYLAPGRGRGGTQEELRYEVKIVVPGALLPLARSWMRAHHSAFVGSYPPRVVNNLYLDTEDLRCLQDNLDGVSERQKVRVRWYGERTSDISPSLEVKQKRERLSWKARYQLSAPCDLSCGETWRSIISRMMVELPPALKAWVGGGWTPILVNRYRREYFESSDRQVRVTLDFAQTVYDQLLSPYPNLTRSAPQPDTAILEIKGEADAWESIREVANGFPFGVSRNSKYLVGYEAILGT